VLWTLATLSLLSACARSDLGAPCHLQDATGAELRPQPGREYLYLGSSECESFACLATPGTSGGYCSQPCSGSGVSCPSGLTCRRSAAPREEPNVPEPAIRFDTSRGTWVVKVEIARTEAEQSRGLMFRTDLPRDRGMLFIFEVPDEHAFWMHNTLIPLDMIFLGEDRAVVGIVSNAAPHTDTLRSVHKPS